MATRNLILILGDQLSPDLSSLRDADPETDRLLIVEVMEEATYVRHHKKKIAFLFSAMRHFAEEMRAAGWTVDYVTLDDEDNSGSFTGEVERAAERLSPEALIVTEPGEWRVRQMMDAWESDLGCPVDIREDDRFIATHEEFQSWAEGRKQLRMEYFYREMRKKTGLLMHDGEPAGGEWNYDQDNRKPAEADLFMPKPDRFQPDEITEDVIALVADTFEDHFGDLEPFWIAVTREDAETALNTFISDALPRFGDYQDAMLKDEKFLYHSILSLYINCGLLDPLEVCKRAEAAYQSGDVPINSAEGFIRQIIGWREYVRGIYFLEGPDYPARNVLKQDRDLPAFYWGAETRMNCVSHAVRQTREQAYAHHIQRLMVTGNFAMLIGVDPKQIHEWYLIVYADAYEWVELPNTLGMSQFADGGLLGSKPYAASGNYINKMSDYCADCWYDVKQKTGDNACPFNALYWDFLARNEDRLRGNHRLAQIYRVWDRMGESTQHAYRSSAAQFLETL